MSKELLIELEIPLYIREYLKSKNVRAKYYQEGDTIPKRFGKDASLYAWRSFTKIENGKKVSKKFLVEKLTGNKVISNPHLAGQEKRININGQGIYNGTIQEFDRNNMIGQIKDSFRSHVRTLKPINRFPLRLDVFLFDTIIDDFSNGQDWDLDNRFYPYGKTFQDLLTEVKTEKGNVPNKLYNEQDFGKIIIPSIIPDDNRFYITDPPHAIFVPVDDMEDRKLVVRIYKDNRSVILNNYLYQRKHGEQLK